LKNAAVAKALNSDSAVIQPTHGTLLVSSLNHTPYHSYTTPHHCCICNENRI
jgi:hypothetical protein